MTSASDHSVAAWLGPAKQPPSIGGWLALDRIRHSLFELPDSPVTLGRYRLGPRLGEGGCGSVFAGFDPQLGRDVAIKVLHAAPHGELARDRLRDEARALAALQHPNIVALFDFGEAAPTLADGIGEAPQPAAYVVMERVHGLDLGAWLAANGRDESRIVALALQAADALAAAHDVGIVHRDVKPANLLVTSEGRVRIVDFGMAGTPAYMAPEQHAGLLRPTEIVVDARADQFALAVTIFEAVVGARPFAGDDVDALGRTKSDGAIAWPRRRSPAQALRRVVERALAVDPSARFPDMRALAAALAACAHPRRRSVGLGLVAVGLAAAAGLVALAAADTRPAAPLATATTGLPLAQRLATADALEHERRYDEAIAITSAAIAARDESEAPAEIAALLSRRGSANVRKGDIADARRDLARAYFLAADSGAHATAARTALRMMVCEASHARAPAEALVWARHAEAELARAEPMPDAEAALAYARGVSFAALGLSVSAHDAYQRAADGYLALDRPDVRRAAFALVELGNTDLVAHDLDHAATHFEAALALVTVPGRADDIESAGVLERIASVRTRERRWDDARALYQRAFAVRERVLGRDHVDVALVAYNRAVLETWAGDHASSEAWFDRAATIYASALGSSSPQLALALDGRGTARQRLGRFAEAIDDHEAALAMLEHAVAPLDPRQLAVTSAHAANALGERGAWARAVVRAQQGLEALRTSPVPDAATEQSCREILAAASHHGAR